MAMPTRTTNWEMIYQLAEEAGAKFPELVCAQWKLESSGGNRPSGRHNYFGLKSATGDGGTVKSTTEVVNGKEVVIKAKFKDFESPKAAVEYLVRLWYKDYESYKGCNNAPTREKAAQMLQDGSYATDPKYAEKLIRIMREHDLVQEEQQEKPKAPARTEFVIEALQETWLKKEPVQAADLPENKKVLAPRGRTYGVVGLVERAADAHEWVELAAGAGSWWVFGPHWQKVEEPPSGVPPVAIDWTDFNCRVGEFLTVGEVLQYDMRRVPKGAVINRIMKTADQFEQIRRAWGRHIGVTSFYRPEPINSQVGGVPNSRHVSGEAMDIYPIGSSINTFYQWIRQRWTGGLGDGRHRGFIHLDTRNNGHFVPGAGVRPYVEFGY